MNFQELVAKMQELDTARVDVPTDEACGDPMPAPMAPTMPPKPEEKPRMNLTISAEGDAIADAMKLFQKVNPDMMPKVPEPMPSAPMPIAIKPINKLIPDFDGDNDDMPGGEKDMIDIKALGDKGDDNDYDDDGKLDAHEKDHDEEEKLHKTVDRDDDGDHDMDDHDIEKDDEDEKEKDEAWANEPDEDEKDIDYMVNKMSGGMNRRKDTHPKVAGADNPMQKVKEEVSLVDQIRSELQKALAETKGAK